MSKLKSILQSDWVKARKVELSVGLFFGGISGAFGVAALCDNSEINDIAKRYPQSAVCEETLTSRPGEACTAEGYAHYAKRDVLTEPHETGRFWKGVGMAFFALGAVSGFLAPPMNTGTPGEQPKPPVPPAVPPPSGRINRPDMN